MGIPLSPTGRTTDQDLGLANPRHRRAALPLFGLGCFLALLLIRYRSVLFEGGQFASANRHTSIRLICGCGKSGEAGGSPLWDPGHNGGEPLLGNPMFAVFYPGKVLYTLFPYAWSARLHVIAHTVLAFSGLLVLGRSFWCELGGIVPFRTELCVAVRPFCFSFETRFVWSKRLGFRGASVRSTA